MEQQLGVTEGASPTREVSSAEQATSEEGNPKLKLGSSEGSMEEQASFARAAPAGWRPPTTKRQAESTEIDWSRTYHVNSPEAFINGLFGLYSGVFESFLADAGKEAALGETVLYQTKDPAHLRFELKKIGPNEFEVRGAHFATPSAVNICIGFDPLEPSQSQAGAKVAQ